MKRLMVCCLFGLIGFGLLAQGVSRFEVGINAYQPSDNFVNGSLRANTPQFPFKGRIGYVFDELLGGELITHLDYQPEFKNNIARQTGLSLNISPDWVKSQHISLGVLWNWRYFGFGPEMRSESYRAISGDGRGLDSVRINRLWWRFSVGYISPPAPLRVVARIELAGTDKVPSHNVGPDVPSLLRAMAPDHEYGLYAGVRF